MKALKFLFALLALLVAPSLAHAQSAALVQNPVVTNNCVSWGSNGFVKDSGVSCANVAANLNQRAHISAYGTCNGFSDTALLTNAIASVQAVGGTFLSIAGQRCGVSGNSLIVPQSFTLDGGVPTIPPPANGRYGPPAPDFSAVRGALIVTSGVEVQVGQGGTLQNVYVLRAGLATPTSWALAYAIPYAFAGTGVHLTSDDGAVNNVMIIGFYACLQSSGQRPLANHVRGDCTNGVITDGALDVAKYYDMHMYPYATIGWGEIHKSITAVTNNGSGLYRLTVDNTDNFSSGEILLLGSDLMLGDVGLGANKFRVTIVDNTHIDLQGTTYTTPPQQTGTIYLWPGRRSGAAFIYARADFAICTSCFEVNWDTGFDIGDGANWITVTNWGVDSFFSPFIQDNNGVRIHGNASRALFTQGYTSSYAYPVKMEANASITYPHAFSNISFGATNRWGFYMDSGAAIITGSSFVGDKPISVANAVTGLVMSGVQLNGTRFSYQSPANAAKVTVYGQEMTTVRQYTPPSSAATCTQGEMSFDTAFVFVCVAANQWRRVPQNTF